MSQPITDRKIRFAIVGCGRISKNHIASIREHVQDAASDAASAFALTLPLDASRCRCFASGKRR